MFNCKKIIFAIFLFFSFYSNSIAEVVKKIEVKGNERISLETIVIFGDIVIGKNYEISDVNQLIKKLYETTFFQEISVELENNKLSILVKENAIISCGGKSRIIKNENEEIINTEVKDLIDGIGKYVEFTVVETDKKGGKYRIINCFPSEEPQDSIVKTIKTNYKLNN